MIAEVAVTGAVLWFWLARSCWYSEWQKAGLGSRCFAGLPVGWERPSGGNRNDRPVGQDPERKGAGAEVGQSFPKIA